MFLPAVHVCNKIRKIMLLLVRTHSYTGLVAEPSDADERPQDHPNDSGLPHPHFEQTPLHQMCATSGPI
jgi:hypothetical protein